MRCFKQKFLNCNFLTVIILLSHLQFFHFIPLVTFSNTNRNYCAFLYEQQLIFLSSFTKRKIRKIFHFCLKINLQKESFILTVIIFFRFHYYEYSWNLYNTSDHNRALIQKIVALEILFDKVWTKVHWQKFLWMKWKNYDTKD